MGHLQRTYPAYTTPFEQYGFVTDHHFANDDKADETIPDMITPIYRPQPSDDLMDETLADSFPASDPLPWY